MGSDDLVKRVPHSSHIRRKSISIGFHLTLLVCCLVLFCGVKCVVTACGLVRGGVYNVCACDLFSVVLC